LGLASLNLVNGLTLGGLLERDGEMSRLRGALDDARNGRGGAIVLEGPAGIGKTELLRETLTHARDEGMTVGVAHGSEFERDFSFGVVRQLFEPLVAQTPEQARPALFGGAASLARATLASAGAESDAAATEFPTLHGLYWLAVNISDRDPLVLSVDDLHWADGASLRWIAFLARRLEGLPILLLATVRTEAAAGADRAGDDVLTGRLVTALRPSPLGEQAVGELIADVLDEQPDPEFSRACLSATRGNPLFLRELLATLRERGTAPVRANSSQIESVGPKAITRMVLARLAALGPDADRLARAAAIAGDEADHELVREVSGLDPAAFKDAAARLAGSDLVAIEPRVEFVHPVTRSAIVESLEPAERATLAQRAAAALEVRGDLEGVASHLVAVPGTGDQRTVEIMRTVSADALARGSPETAVTLLERARAEPPAPAEKAALLHELGLAMLRTEAPAALVHLRTAYEETPPGALRARRAEDLAHALQGLNRPAEALQVAEDALNELGQDGGESADRLAARVVEVARFVPEHAEVERRVAAAAAQISDRKLRARVSGIRAYDTMLSGASPEEVVTTARSALVDGGLAEDTGEGSMPVFLACMALAAAGEAEKAAGQIERALDTARRRGSVVSYCGALSIRSRLRLWRGDLPGAEADAREISELGDQGMARDYVNGSLVASLTLQGKLDEADEAVRAGPLGGEIPSYIVFNPGLHARGALRIAQGRIEEGLSDVLRCGERQEAAGATNPADLPWRGTAALTLAKLGRDAEAELMSAAHVKAAREFGVPAVVGAAERVRATIVGGSEGLRIVESAVKRLEGSPATLEHALALLELGRARHATGDEAGARTTLQEARVLAEQCGAEPVVALALEATVAAGGRPRRGQAQGAEALTPAERRTAEEAARGLSNRDIAQAHFVTEKTVEAHLSRVYRKLGINSRAQIGPRLSPGSAEARVA
jgi:DNA-binding CsgD family transcriptional regulator